MVYQDLKKEVRSNRLSNRISYLYVGRARLDVDDSGLVLTNANQKVFQQIPVASIALIMLEPGSIVTHEAVKLCSVHKCLLLWVGEGGVRLYSSGFNDFSSAERILHQAKMFHDDFQRLTVVRRMYQIRFKKECPTNKSIEQLRGMEGIRVRKNYQILADKYGVSWNGRCYDVNKWDKADVINRVISVGCACLYGICEAAILTAGYSPTIGFIHSGKSISFVYDIGDLYKDELVLPFAFKLVAENPTSAENKIRYELRDEFKKSKFLGRIIPDLEELLTFKEPPVYKYPKKKTATDKQKKEKSIEDSNDNDILTFD